MLKSFYFIKKWIPFNKGISRAPAIVLAYIISEKALNLKESLDYLKEKYKKADPNLGFMMQLDEFYKSNFEKIVCWLKKKQKTKSKQKKLKNFFFSGIKLKNKFIKLKISMNLFLK